jgi:hypothetical protein
VCVRGFVCVRVRMRVRVCVHMCMCYVLCVLGIMYVIYLVLDFQIGKTEEALDWRRTVLSGGAGPGHVLEDLGEG